MEKIILLCLLSGVIMISGTSGSTVPVVAWSNTRNLFATRQISAGEEVTRESLKNDFVDQVIRADQQPQTIAVVLMNKMKLGDLTRYSNAYGSDNQGGIIPTIKNSMESSASSLVLPQTDTSDLVDDLMSKITEGEILELSNPIDVKSMVLDSRKTNLVIIRVEPSDSMEDQLKAADKYVQILMTKLKGKTTPFTLFFTAAPVSQDSSHASGRRLLQTADDATKFTFINFTSDGCELYFYAESIMAQWVKGDGEVNATVTLPTTGWMSTGSDCLSNRSLTFNLEISGLEGLNGTKWIESVSFMLDFNMTNRDFWFVSNSSITAKLTDKDEETYWTDIPNLETPLGWSYHCGDLSMTNDKIVNETVNLIFKDFQIQPFGISKGKFSSANDCIGYFTPAIWMGIMTALLVIAIIGFGIGMMATVKVMDKFDDPKGKQLMINVPES